MSTPRTNERSWFAWDLEALIWFLFQLVGVPLTMLEFAQLGKYWVVIALAILWLPTIAFLVLDFMSRTISRTSIAFFLVWAVLALWYALHSHGAV